MEELSQFLSPGEYHNMVWFYQAVDEEVPEVAIIEDEQETQVDPEEDRESSKVCKDGEAFLTQILL